MTKVKIVLFSHSLDHLFMTSDKRLSQAKSMAFFFFFFFQAKRLDIFSKYSIETGIVLSAGNVFVEKSETVFLIFLLLRALV